MTLTTTLSALVRRVTLVTGLHTDAELRAATQAVHNRLTADIDAAQEMARRFQSDLAQAQAEADRLRAEVARLAETRTGEAVDQQVCPRCAAPAGSRCVGPTGEVLRRTHRERTDAWRRAQEFEPEPEPAGEAER